MHHRIIHARLLPFLLTMGMVLAVTPSVHALTWYVDDDGSPMGDGTFTNPYNNIQSAVDMATDNDTILVRAGTYQGPGNRSVTISGKHVMLVGETGPAGTIVDAQSSAVCLIVLGSAASGTVIDGFTFTNGYNTYLGGAITCDEADTTIRNCRFRNNQAGLPGGMSSALGGALAVSDADADIQDSTFTANFANAHGGAIYAENGTLTVARCTFLGNESDLFGGAVSLAGVSASLAGCTFLTNHAHGGGAVHSSATCTTAIRHCTFARNSAADDRIGGGAFLGTGSLSHCVFWANIAPTAPQISLFNSAGVDLDYGLVQGRLDGIGPAEFMDGLTLGDGIIDTDPQLTPDGHLRPGSPCINAGDFAFITTPENTTDRDGEARVDFASARVDIGSDEWSDTHGNGLPDWWDLQYFGVAPDTQGYSLSWDFNDMTTQGWIVYNDPGGLVGVSDPTNFTPSSYAYLYVPGNSASGSEAYATYSLLNATHSWQLTALVAWNAANRLHRSGIGYAYTDAPMDFKWYEGKDPDSINIKWGDDRTPEWTGGQGPTAYEYALWDDVGNQPVDAGEAILTIKYNTPDHPGVILLEFDGISYDDSRKVAQTTQGTCPIDPATSAPRTVSTLRLGGNRAWAQAYFDNISFTSYPQVTPPEAGDDADLDGLSNGDEYERYSSHPYAPAVYVDPSPAFNSPDFDHDGDVDADDTYFLVQVCWSGENIPQTIPGCEPALLDGDDDVDDDDLAILTGCLSGADVPAAPECQTAYSTLQGGLNAADELDTVVVASGLYSGIGNTDLDFGRKSIVLRAESAPATTVVQGGLDTLIDASSLRGTFTAIDGLHLRMGTATDGAGIRVDRAATILNNDLIKDNTASSGAGGIHSEHSAPSFDNVTLEDNDAPTGQPEAGRIVNSNVHLAGDLNVVTGTLEVQSSWFDGPGGIVLSEDTQLLVTGDDPGDAPTFLRSDVTGTGSIHIEQGQQMVLASEATINLSGTTSTQCIWPDGTGSNKITVDGTLVVQDCAAVQNTYVDVRLLDIAHGAAIENNNIFAIENDNLGGEFYVRSNTSDCATPATIKCNYIRANGDRYLDLDPDPAANPADRPVIENNKIEVSIYQGPGSNQGTLLELRAMDYHCNPTIEDCPSGAFEWATPDQFDDAMMYPANNWVLDKLIVGQDAKVNLTNRQGFDFNGEEYPDTIYVKELHLYTDSTLNLAGQRLYYGNMLLFDSLGQPFPPGEPPYLNGAQIVDVPLLGFSLGIIGMDDDTEFDVRIRKRETDVADLDPMNPDAPLPRGTVHRLADGIEIGNGVMEMMTRADGETQSATSVAAKGHFVRAGEDEILVLFLYLWQTDDPTAELVVKLSGNRSVGEDNIEVARLRPEPGQPGAFGSGEYGIYYEYVPRGSLNLTRGTFIELELRGDDAGIWIENWDPEIACSTRNPQTCGDLNDSWFGIVDESDYLLLLASNGLELQPEDPADPESTYAFWCLDLTGDKYVDLSDFMMWDAVYSTGLDLCGLEDTPVDHEKITAPTDAGDATFLFAGKQETMSGGQYNERLYPFDDTAVSVDANGVTSITGSICPATPIAPAAGAGEIGNYRTVVDSANNVYQIHHTDGIYRIDTSPAANHEHVLAPGSRLVGDATVRVGLEIDGGDFLGLPISDAAIETVGNTTYAYVVPVRVERTDGGTDYSYRAGAKIQLGAGSPYTWQIVSLYGSDPGGPLENWSPTNLQAVREIELSDDGTQVFIASATAFNDNDYILTFDEADPDPAPESYVLLDSFFAEPAHVPHSPSAMLVAGDRLYLTTPIRPLDPNGLPVVASPYTDGARIWRFQIDPTGTISSPAMLTITNPTVANPNPGNPMVGYVTSMARRGATLWALGYVSPTYDSTQSPGGTQLFTTPMLALVQDAWFATPPANLTAAAIDCQDFALPVGLTVLAGTPDMDFDNDGDVDQVDFGHLQACYSGIGVPQTDPACADARLDADDDVDGDDVTLFEACDQGPAIPAAPNCIGG